MAWRRRQRGSNSAAWACSIERRTGCFVAMIGRGEGGGAAPRRTMARYPIGDLTKSRSTTTEEWECCYYDNFHQPRFIPQQYAAETSRFRSG